MDDQLQKNKQLIEHTTHRRGHLTEQPAEAATNRTTTLAKTHLVEVKQDALFARIFVESSIDCSDHAWHRVTVHVWKRLPPPCDGVKPLRRCQFTESLTLAAEHVERTMDPSNLGAKACV